MHDDESAGNALGALAGEPVPMATTSVEDVIRKGKRRLRVQRVATVGGVAAVVAVIAAGTLLFRPDGSGSGVPVASQPTAPSTGALAGYSPVPRAPGPGDVHTSPIGPPPTGTTFTTTTTKLPVGAGVGDRCDAVFLTPAHAPGLPKSTVDQTLLHAYYTTTGHNPVAVRPSGRDTVDRTDGTVQRVVVEDKAGELVLDLSVHGGTPQEAANASLGPAPECATPRRKTLSDGTVMQLYPRGSKAQLLQVFTPSGRTYLLTLIPDIQWPLTEEQLATVADEVAKLG
ncbi:hypothetical protein [Labedaea rhizosphaerae]|uniref:Uncharacterized protein n=1 Tax=Labedaea rhizosphaerae TaxID=598644 RepID=A0A4R6SMG7_LABRH|nr:hypothetical protein [Labedaea rhizosphaerae]TDQ05081.1 hypothetical protein EV186_1011045 [Labedaea rhizosphaerae]